MNSESAASPAFAPTRWTLILRARGETPDARAALSELCEGYYPDLADWRVKATIFNRCPRANPSTSRGRFAKGLVVQT